MRCKDIINNYEKEVKEVFNEEEVFDEEQREKLKIRLYNDFQKQLENTMLIPFVETASGTGWMTNNGQDYEGEFLFPLDFDLMWDTEKFEEKTPHLFLYVPSPFSKDKEEIIIEEEASVTCEFPAARECLTEPYYSYFKILSNQK